MSMLRWPVQADVAQAACEFESALTQADLFLSDLAERRTKVDQVVTRQDQSEVYSIFLTVPESLRSNIWLSALWRFWVAKTLQPLLFYTAFIVTVIGSGAALRALIPG